jgi:hypothetical protein
MLTLIEIGKGLLNGEGPLAQFMAEPEPWPCGHNACELCGALNQTKFLKATQAFYHS